MVEQATIQGGVEGDMGERGGLVVKQISDLTRDASIAFLLELWDGQVFGCVIAGLIGFLVCLTAACSLLFVTTLLTGQRLSHLPDHTL